GSHAAAGAWWGPHHHATTALPSATTATALNHHHHHHHTQHNHQHTATATIHNQLQHTAHHTHPPPHLPAHLHATHPHHTQHLQQQPHHHLQQHNAASIGLGAANLSSTTTLLGADATIQQQQQQSTTQSNTHSTPTHAVMYEDPPAAVWQSKDMSLSLAHQLHIPAAIRPGFETEASAAVKRHPHPWPYESDGFSSAQYHHASQYYLDRERKPGFYGYPETPQFQPYWNYREQPISAAAAAYMSASDDRHASVSAAAAARQSVEGTSQSSYETPTYSSPGGLRAYPSDAYASTGGLAVGAVGSCTPTNPNPVHEWTVNGPVSARKKRKPYSKFQTLELEKEFLYNAYVSKQKRWELARNLNLSERQVS
uniref:Homeobox domain-containing protein n=1 Tax=Glossina palpalis gambiensis TaxID=67801 RepID=A0A1B0AWI6_9MUSC